MELQGLHHLTAVTGDAPENVRFYTGTLGLRLVKKTVNQDDVSAYHLFYADEKGSPGTEVTFFDWPGSGPARAGIGTIGLTSLAVPAGSLNWWAGRLTESGVEHGGIEQRGRRRLIAFADPEGQRLELVDAGDLPSDTARQGGSVPPQFAIRGLHAVTLTVADPGPTQEVLTRILGCRRGEGYDGPGGQQVAVFETGPGGSGTEVHLLADPRLPYGRVGFGGVHHVAFRTPTDEEHQRWQQRLAAAGLGVTPVIDRYYFRSIYFREPGGILFEVATDGPGFATDEDLSHLGERLALPPFLEPHRAKIEAGLRPLPVTQVSTSGVGGGVE